MIKTKFTKTIHKKQNILIMDKVSINSQNSAIKRIWLNIPISEDVLSLTFNKRKPLVNYKKILEKELIEKFK